MISPIDIVLIAVMATQNPFSGTYELQYLPLDYFKTMDACKREQLRLTKVNTQKGKVYLCLNVDRN